MENTKIISIITEKGGTGKDDYNIQPWLFIRKAGKKSAAYRP